MPDVDAPSELDTHNVMQWGQFVDHDITHTPLFRCSIMLQRYWIFVLFLCRLSNDNSSGIQCCNDDGSGPIRPGLEESKNHNDDLKWIFVLETFNGLENFPQCPDNSKLVVHPECFPIDIPENDPFYQKFGQKCMNFVRSMPAPQLREDQEPTC